MPIARRSKNPSTKRNALKKTRATLAKQKRASDARQARGVTLEEETTQRAQPAAPKVKRHPALERAFEELKAHAAKKPGAWEDHPWGETVYKIKKKVFVFLGVPSDELGMSVKLPHSGEAALTLFPFASSTGYGLGKSGWVTARFKAGQEIPLMVLREWIDESFAAVLETR